ncbi:MAG: hypothetical protein GF364_17455 [Candidatus Lokiarchaeota archaeon]|nr:hypothetical protein [Candidatus Lokiarchaeota archaeon]
MKKVNGILAPIPTFIDKEGKIDLDANKNVCDSLCETEIGGLYILGTTGEFAYFSLEQRKKLISFLCNDCEFSKPMIMCVQHWNTDKAVELTEYALKNGVKLISALLPIYFPLSDQGIISYFTAIHEVIEEYDSNIPLYVYHIPILPSTAEIKAEIIVKLADSGVINGIKDSVFDYTHAKEILEGVGKGFNFLCGTEPLLVDAFREGSVIDRFDGGVFTGVNILPNTYARLFKAAKEGDKNSFNRIWPYIDELIALWDDGVYYLPHVCKYGMKYLGYDVQDIPCQPLDLINNKKKEQTQRIIDNTKKFWGSHDV